MILDRSGQHRGFPGRAQNRIDQIARGGLAVCARDADQRNLLVEFSVEGLRRQRESVTPVLDLESTARRSPAGAGNSLTTAIAPFVDGLRGELAAVHARTWKREKQISLAAIAAGIVVEALNLRLGERGRQLRMQRNFRQHLAHCHRRNFISAREYDPDLFALTQRTSRQRHLRPRDPAAFNHDVDSMRGGLLHH